MMTTTGCRRSSWVEAASPEVEEAASLAVPSAAVASLAADPEETGDS